jgi:iron complex outermembrane receptor protein
MRYGSPRRTVLVLATLVALPASLSAQADEPSGLSLDSLLATPVSTAAKYDQKQTDAPAFVTIVTAKDIQRYGFRTLADVLQDQVGFYVANDRQYADVGLRGFGRTGQYNNKVLLLVDGHALHEHYTGGARMEEAMPLDLGDVQRIEIVRGPGSALYGARAMLAVVNLVMRTGRDLDGLEAVGTVGSFDTYGASLSHGAVWGPDTDLALTASWGRTSGEEDLYFPELDIPGYNNGHSVGLDWARHVKGRAAFRRGGLTAQVAAGQRERGIPTAAYQSTFNHPDAETRDGQAFAEVSYRHTVSSTTELHVRGYFDDAVHEGVYPNGEASVPAASGPAALVRVLSRAFGSEARVRFDLSARNRLVMGVEGVRATRASHDITNMGQLYLGGDFPYTLLSAFAQDELELTPDLVLTVGLRRDQYSTKGSATTPRGALVYHASPTTTLKAMAGEAFRAPNVLELRMNQPYQGLIANPDLDPERLRTYEVAWDQRFGGVATTVSLSHNRARDLIDLVEVPTPDSLRHYGSWAFLQKNVASARSIALDAEARTALPSGVLARVGYSFLHTRDEMTGAALVNAPSHQMWLTAERDLPASSHVGVTLRRGSGRTTLYGTSTLPATVVDVTVVSNAFGNGFTVQGSVKNVFDASFSTPGGFQHIQSAIPQPRRHATIRVGWNW